MEKQRSAGVVVYRYNEARYQREYLLLQYLGGHWDFPKGKLEGAEEWLEAALREVHEETGLDVAIDPNFKHMFSYRFYDARGRGVEKTVVFYLGEAPDLPVKLSKEHVDYIWLPFDQAIDIVTFENAKTLINKAESHLIEKDFA